MEAFLSTQHRLEKIAMRCWRQDWRPRAEVVVPSLKELLVDGDPTAALILRSGGTLETLRMLPNASKDLPTSLPERFLAGLQDVSTLEIGSHRYNLQWLEAMAKYLTNVRELTLWTTVVRFNVFRSLVALLIRTSKHRFHSFSKIFLS
jgi:hypothetical protein